MVGDGIDIVVSDGIDGLVYVCAASRNLSNDTTHDHEEWPIYDFATSDMNHNRYVVVLTNVHVQFTTCGNDYKCYGWSLLCLGSVRLGWWHSGILATILFVMC